MHYTRMCLRFWSFRHEAGDTIDYSVDTHPVGLELRVSMNRQLLHSQVYRDPDELMNSAERGARSSRSARLDDDHDREGVVARRMIRSSTNLQFRSHYMTGRPAFSQESGSRHLPPRQARRQRAEQRRPADHRPPVVLLGGSANALSIARSLGRRGIQFTILARLEARQGPLQSTSRT